MSEESPVRLQKALAHAGVASRRQSEELIQQGRVTVNGRVITKLGTKVNPALDEIRVDGRRVRVTRSYAYILVNKPQGVLSTMKDSRGRRTLGDLVSVPTRMYPVGRLDANSQGLILLTDDGELANLLTHPRYRHEKEYRVLVNGSPSDETLESWRHGILLDEKPTAPAKVEVVRRDRQDTLLRIEIHEGRKRQIRRVADLLGHPVRELTRVRLGPLHLGTLQVGEWRYLTPQEIRSLESLKKSTRKRGQKPERSRAKR